MRVILLEDVKKIGKKGDVVDVNDGYARNYLIPRQLAVEATAGQMKQLQTQKKAAARRAEKEKAEAEAVLAKLDGGKVIVHAKCGEGGRLFGSVTGQDVADAIKGQFGIDIDRRKVELAENIKALGTYQVGVRLYPQMVANITVEVTEAK
ncbi:MAG: 50S ribosomal protein L9 [Limnochordia bacterium]|jgi:large subunit ribosomal protein L9